MNEQQIADQLIRIMNAQESQLELLTGLQERIGQLEQGAAIRDQITSRAKQAVELHQQALGQIGEAIGDILGKMQQLNGNETALQAELLRQREELASLGAGRLPSAVC